MRYLVIAYFTLMTSLTASCAGFLSDAFVVKSLTTKQTRRRQGNLSSPRRVPVTLSLYDDPVEDSYSNSQEWSGRREQNSTIATSTTNLIYESLSQRQNDLRRGIGRRYVVHTTRGFLNVHSSCTHKEGPFAVDNIVAQLSDGQVITSVGPPVDGWIQHNFGGLECQ